MFMSKRKLNDKMVVNLDKYISKESLVEFGQNVEKSLSFLFTLLMPVIILNVIFLSISVFIRLWYNSGILYILFFVISLVVSIIGGGVFGLRCAIKNTVSGIKGIAGYSFALFRDVYPVIKKEKELKGLSPAETYRVISLGIVLPVVKHVLDRRLLGGIFYFFVEQIITRSSGIIEGAINKITYNSKETRTNSGDEFSEEAFPMAMDPVLEKAGLGFDAVVKGIIMFLDIIWVITSVLGLLALTVLVIMFNIR